MNKKLNSEPLAETNGEKRTIVYVYSVSHPVAKPFEAAFRLSYR